MEPVVGAGSSVSRPLRVLVICGSPRRRGNSAALVDVVRSALAGVATSDPSLSTDVEVVWPAELAIEGCTACGGCDATGQCTTPDAMVGIYDSIDGADALLWISPVYFSSIPSQLKAFVDRFQVYWARRTLRRLAGTTLPRTARRPAGAVLLRGGGDPFGADGAVTPLRAASNLAEFALVDPLVIEGPDTTAPVTGERFANERELVADLAVELVVRARVWVDAHDAEGTR